MGVAEHIWHLIVSNTKSPYFFLCKVSLLYVYNDECGIFLQLLALFVEILPGGGVKIALRILMMRHLTVSLSAVTVSRRYMNVLSDPAMSTRCLWINM